MQTPPVFSQSQHITVPGGQLFLKQWQPANRQRAPIILLHDSLGCVGLWRDFPEQLAQQLGHPIIAYDRLGFGQSSARYDVLTADFIQSEAELIFPAICDALNIKQFILLGHSVGGGMALRIASSQNSSHNGCLAVITEAAQAFVAEQTLQGIQAAKAQFDDPQAFAKLRKWHGDKAHWVLNAWYTVWHSEAFQTWRIDPEARAIQCPVLAIHGDLDEYGSMEFPQHIINTVSGSAEMVMMKQCGHVPHRERCDEVINHINTFLDT